MAILLSANYTAFCGQDVRAHNLPLLSGHRKGAKRPTAIRRLARTSQLVELHQLIDNSPTEELAIGLLSMAGRERV
jgi:predicted alpha/beta-hydrolase family hydrolase